MATISHAVFNEQEVTRRTWYIVDRSYLFGQELALAVAAHKQERAPALAGPGNRVKLPLCVHATQDIVSALSLCTDHRAGAAAIELIIHWLDSARHWNMAKTIQSFVLLQSEVSSGRPQYLLLPRTRSHIEHHSSSVLKPLAPPYCGLRIPRP